MIFKIYNQGAQGSKVKCKMIWQNFQKILKLKRHVKSQGYSTKKFDQRK